ncbi:OmpA family protein [Vibrio sp. SS-MA-C1-2]|uniref:OmpA family protein n=1 Tax=Vibrio sp. SS-MA-C1-2 TaxID=2908646 RepID=UPI001F282C30|nr:OmpA family protein [Vibrio sp. SS-MA-C1-2]UJF17476.1 OmpA family protein [Vibrio sp. SS-MA-C1-2]
MMNKTTLTIALFSLMLTGCSSTEKIYAKYDTGVCVVDSQAKQIVSNVTTELIPIKAPAVKVPAKPEWPEGIFFELNQAELDQQDKQQLNRYVAELKKYPESSIMVIGYADARGDRSYNDKLSLQRATHVGQYLTQQGIASHRIQTMAAGERYPIKQAGKVADYANHRRVQLLLTDFNQVNREQSNVNQRIK